MPRYFFHFYNGQFDRDHDGIECASDEKARSMAVTAAGEAIRDFAAEESNRPSSWHMQVTNEDGRLLISLRFDIKLPPAGTPFNFRED